MKIIQLIQVLSDLQKVGHKCCSVSNCRFHKDQVGNPIGSVVEQISSKLCGERDVESFSLTNKVSEILSFECWNKDRKSFLLAGGQSLSFHKYQTC